MGVGILAKRVVLELGSSTNFVYSLKQPVFTGCFFHNLFFNSKFTGRITDRHHKYCLFRFVNPKNNGVMLHKELPLSPVGISPSFPFWAAVRHRLQ